MSRILSAHRPASWDRSRNELHDAQKVAGFRPPIETIARTDLAADENHALSAILQEAAFDVLGAARWIRTENHSFARAALQSALTELHTVIDRLEVVP